MLWYRVASGRDSEVTCQQGCSCWMYTCRVEWVFRNGSNGFRYLQFLLHVIRIMPIMLSFTSVLELNQIEFAFCTIVFQKACLQLRKRQESPDRAVTKDICSQSSVRNHLMHAGSQKTMSQLERRAHLNLACHIWTCHSCMLSTRSTYLNMIFQVWKCWNW